MARRVHRVPVFAPKPPSICLEDTEEGNDLRAVPKTAFMPDEPRITRIMRIPRMRGEPARLTTRSPSSFPSRASRGDSPSINRARVLLVQVQLAFAVSSRLYSTRE